MPRLTGHLSIPKIPIWSLLALACALVGIPAVFGLAGLLKDTPIRVGEPSPRTVIAPTLTRVPDPAETELARRQAAATVELVLRDDAEARTAIVQQVRDVFAAVESARLPGPDGQVASAEEQARALSPRLRTVSTQGLALLVGLPDPQLAQVRGETVSIAQQLARQRITAEGLPEVIDGPLRTELALRSFPAAADGAGDVAADVVVPLIGAALQPTVTVDQEATAEARRVAAEQVTEVERSFVQGSPIVTAGEVVDEVQLAALERRGLEGTQPWVELLEAAVLALALTLTAGLYLRAYRRDVWERPRRRLLLALLALFLAVAVQVVGLIEIAGSARLYLIPVGAIVMLTTILFDAPVALLMLVPAEALVAYHAPSEPAVILFTAVAGLVSVPLVSRLSARGQLRRAAWQSTLAYGAVAGACAGIFDRTEAILPAVLAGLVGGALTALIVNGLLPFLDSWFGILTATSLLDLADRNHPLLRELGEKAPGTYNHSIMVATMVERACRAIGADSLLGNVAALYHDIGKVNAPLYFAENQFGVANPHDKLDPARSATIIQRHVTDGVTMATEYRLPPEVVEGIASHHGTTYVSYFYRKALLAAKDPTLVDAEHFRYKGPKPSSREAAVLMLADCCESASRAATQADPSLAQQQLEEIVTRLVKERADDGQLDECLLTFADLLKVKQSFVEALVGFYHPRITYPEQAVEKRRTLSQCARCEPRGSVPFSAYDTDHSTGGREHGLTLVLPHHAQPRAGRVDHLGHLAAPDRPPELLAVDLDDVTARELHLDVPPPVDAPNATPNRLDREGLIQGTTKALGVASVSGQ